MSKPNDIPVQELEHIYDQVDLELAAQGMPTDEELQHAVEEMNKPVPFKVR